MVINRRSVSRPWVKILTLVWLTWLLTVLQVLPTDLLTSTIDRFPYCYKQRHKHEVWVGQNIVICMKLSIPAHGLFLYIFSLEWNAGKVLGHLLRLRVSGSVLCRVESWDCFWERVLHQVPAQPSSSQWKPWKKLRRPHYSPIVQYYTIPTYSSAQPQYGSFPGSKASESHG